MFDFIYNLLDSPEQGHRPIGNYVPSIKRYKWILSRMSGDSSGTINITGVRHMEAECLLHNINPTKVPVSWMERRFLTYVMDHMNGLDVTELIPENVVNFERKMRARYNKIKGSKVLVHIDSGERFFVTVDGVDERHLGGLLVKKENFFNKIKSPKIRITLPMHNADDRLIFIDRHSVCCKLIGQLLRDIDDRGL